MHEPAPDPNAAPGAPDAGGVDDERAVTTAPQPPDHGERPAGLGGPDDVELIPLDPRVRWLWTLSGAIVVGQVALPLLVLEALRFLPGPRGAILGGWLVLGCLGSFGLALLRYRRWRYAMRARDLWIRQGVLWVTISVIPFARLQFVDTRQGPLDRLFGLSTLVVHTAALGTSGRLPGLETRVAEALRERLAEVDASATGASE